ncbi:MAG: ATP-binding response regulator, partial [Rhizobiaceae bacterium]
GAVLDISRLDTGALKPNISTFPLGALLKQIETDFALLASKKNLKLRVVKTSVFVKTDRNLLQRLIQNLVSNAIKYTRTGHIVLGVRRRKGAVEIQIIDTGIGIAEDKTKIVFREFTRLEDGMREAEGLGLGLSIVDRISRVLKLPLTVSSRVNQGTLVKITIGTVARPKDHIETSVRQNGSPVLKLPAMRLVCIDNDPRILSGMSTLLSGWGCQVDTFANSQSALGSGERPDAVLADYHLDNENGLRVISQMRTRFGPELPALLITADRSNEVRQLAEAMDVIVLNKPVKPAALRAALMRNRVEIAAE